MKSKLFSRFLVWALVLDPADLFFVLSGKNVEGLWLLILRCGCYIHK